MNDFQTLATSDCYFRSALFTQVLPVLIFFCLAATGVRIGWWGPGDDGVMGFLLSFQFALFMVVEFPYRENYFHLEAGVVEIFSGRWAKWYRGELGVLIRETHRFSLGEICEMTFDPPPRWTTHPEWKRRVYPHTVLECRIDSEFVEVPLLLTWHDRDALRNCVREVRALAPFPVH